MSQYNWKNVNDVDQIPKTQSIRQIYIWLITKDQKIVIVSKDGKNWQFPGGKPKETEIKKETLIREVQEETGIDITSEYSNVTPFGYYIVTQDENGTEVQFLQLRFYLFMKEESQELDLSPIENPDDPDPIKVVKAVRLEEIEEFIPWLTEVGEYPEIKKIMKI